MKLEELIGLDRIFVNVSVKNRDELLGFLSQQAAQHGFVDSSICADALADREQLGSTGMGNGIALPHARLDRLDKSIGMLVTLARPIDYEAVDQEPVDIVFMILMAAHSGGEQMKVLARVAKLARQEPVMNAIRRASTPQEVFDLLREADAA